MLTAVLAHFSLPDEKLGKNTFSGFAIAIIGVALVVFNGTVTCANYIYVIPFFTMLAGALALDQPVSGMGIIGAVLIMVGLFLADRKK